MPFKMLYYISDVIAYLLYKVLHYRYKVILTNLKNAFPEKSDDPEYLEKIRRLRPPRCLRAQTTIPMNVLG